MAADFTVQLMAAWRRCADARVELGKARLERDRLIRQASRAGMSARAVATAAGVDPARVQQIIEAPTEADLESIIAAVRAAKRR